MWGPRAGRTSLGKTFPPPYRGSFQKKGVDIAPSKITERKACPAVGNQERLLGGESI